MIGGRLVLMIGIAQLVCWGIGYYFIGVFAAPIAADLGWSRTVVFAGFSGALVVMGLSSAAVGRAIDRHGGRPVMTAGSLLLAAGFVLLGLAADIATYAAAWLLLGLAMRMTLYDAAFAALSRIAGPDARLPIAQVTLIGGLASTVFWPVGYGLVAALGWRGALFAYAALALATAPIHWAIPDRRYQAAAPAPAPEREEARDPWTAAAFLYLFVMAVSAMVNAAVSAHMIPLLAALGVAPAAAVGVAALRGIGQSAARLGDVLLGRRLSPFTLAVLATGAVPVALACGTFAGAGTAAAVAFAFLYGAGFGLLTIARGTLPLVLFATGSYGATAGRLLAPGFALSALSPLGYAFAIDWFGARAALLIALALTLLVVAAAVLLNVRERSPIVARSLDRA